MLEERDRLECIWAPVLQVRDDDDEEPDWGNLRRTIMVSSIYAVLLGDSRLINGQLLRACTSSPNPRGQLLRSSMATLFIGFV